MKKIQLITCVLLIQCGLTAMVSAQPPGQARARTRPKVSPYYDLVQQGNNNNGGGTGFQYFRRVRPDVEFRQAENRLQQNLNSLSKRVDDEQKQSELSMLGTTGHAASFMTHGKYFNVGFGSGGR